MAELLGRNFTITDQGGGKRRLLSTIHDLRHYSAYPERLPLEVDDGRRTA